MEYEMPAEGEEGTVMTMDEDDEVVLFWDPTDDTAAFDSGTNNRDSNNLGRHMLGIDGPEYAGQKGIRELAMGAADNIKADKQILNYYRYSYESLQLLR